MFTSSRRCQVVKPVERSSILSLTVQRQSFYSWLLHADRDQSLLDGLPPLAGRRRICSQALQQRRGRPELYADVTPSLVAVQYVWQSELGRREIDRGWNGGRR